MGGVCMQEVVPSLGQLYQQMQEFIDINFKKYENTDNKAVLISILKNLSDFYLELDKTDGDIDTCKKLFIKYESESFVSIIYNEFLSIKRPTNSKKSQENIYTIILEVTSLVFNDFFSSDFESTKMISLERNDSLTSGDEKKETDSIIRNSDSSYAHKTYTKVRARYENLIMDRAFSQSIIALIKSKFNQKFIKNRVFLSHAFKDKLIALSLFLFFGRNNCYLYVDWLVQDRIDNIHELKSSLKKEINRCGQLLFLQTPNSELFIEIENKTRIKYEHHVRQFCAWEIGVFYEFMNCGSDYVNEKYRYSYFNFEHKLEHKTKHKSKLQKGSGNFFLDSLKPAIGISKGKLY